MKGKKGPNQKLAWSSGMCISSHIDTIVCPDSTRKRKQDGSSSSQDSDVVQQPSKKRRPSLVRLGLATKQAEMGMD